MIKHRIFIAINLPQEIKIALFDYQKKWSRSQSDRGSSTPISSRVLDRVGTESGPELPARWTKPENIHITLIFIGYIDEGGVGEIKNIVSKVAKSLKPFSLVLNKISYGPPGITPPRMVWAMGDNSAEFTSLCDKLNNGLAASPKIRFKPEKRESIPHITLARLKEWEWRRIEPEERPEIDEYIDFKIAVKSIELMESVLKRTGPEYKILKSYQLTKK